MKPINLLEHGLNEVEAINPIDAVAVDVETGTDDQTKNTTKDDTGQEKLAPPADVSNGDVDADGRAQADENHGDAHVEGEPEEDAGLAPVEVDNVKTVIVVEGEHNAQSINYALTHAVGREHNTIAAFGVDNWEKSLLPIIGQFKEKRVVILFDAEAQSAARKLNQAFYENGIPSTVRLEEIGSQSPDKSLADKIKEIVADCQHTLDTAELDLSLPKTSAADIEALDEISNFDDLPPATDEVEDNAHNETVIANVFDDDDDLPQNSAEGVVAVDVEDVADDEVDREAEAKRFFDALFGTVTAGFSYLVRQFPCHEDDLFAFDVTDETQRKQMAQKAVEISDAGYHCWNTVNVVGTAPVGGKRGGEETVTYQTAVVADIDVRSPAHKGDADKYPADVKAALNFLPFTPSIIVSSGYGIHAYWIWREPIAITDDNRTEVKRRNNLLIDIVRQRAGRFERSVDGVGDLPRVLRTPGTFNPKLKDRRPLCKIIKLTDARFTPEEFDKKLAEAQPADTLNFSSTAVTKSDSLARTQSARTRRLEDVSTDDTKDRKTIAAALKFIPPSELKYDPWFKVGCVLHRYGFGLDDFDSWSKSDGDSRYSADDCRRLWNSIKSTDELHGKGYTVATLIQIAQQFGYTPTHATTTEGVDRLKEELAEADDAVEAFNVKRDRAIEAVKNLEVFGSATVFADEVVEAAAFAKCYDRQAFSDLKRAIQSWGKSHRDDKVSLHDWAAAVTHKAEEIATEEIHLTEHRNQIQAQINTLNFAAANDLPEGVAFPDKYNVGAQSGIQRVAGRDMIPVCAVPVVVAGRLYVEDNKAYQLTLQFLPRGGKWRNIAAVNRSVVADARKIVALADRGLPVTTTTAKELVDFLAAVETLNEEKLPLIHYVARCGWNTVAGTEHFVDPRRSCAYTLRNGKAVTVEVEDCEFVQSLKAVGSLDEWRRAYELARTSPIARFTVAAACAPPLLKVLDERNFLLYLLAPTRAGKTTSLILAASAVGSEKIVRSFDATKNGLTGAAADVCDFPFLVDEKQVADNRISEQFGNLVYALANGIGRTRLKRDGSLNRTKDWRTIALMTGETQLLPDNVTGGANTRLLTIKTEGKILPDDDCRRIRRIISKNYGHVLPLVVEKIIADRDALRGHFEDLIDRFTARHKETLPDYCRYVALVTIADALIDVSLNPTHNLTAAITVAVDNAEKIFALLPTMTEISDTQREKEFVTGWITQNQQSFFGGTKHGDRIIRAYGKITDDFVFVTVAALQTACREAGFDYRKLVDDLARDGFFVHANAIETDRKNPRVAVKQRIGSVSTRCVQIKNATIGAIPVTRKTVTGIPCDNDPPDD